LPGGGVPYGSYPDGATGLPGGGPTGLPGGGPNDGGPLYGAPIGGLWG
jgi:hypothetical protein